MLQFPDGRVGATVRQGAAGLGENGGYETSFNVYTEIDGAWRISNWASFG